MRQRIKETITDSYRLFVEAFLRALASNFATVIIDLIKSFF